MRNLRAALQVLLLCSCAPTVGPISCGSADSQLGEAGVVRFSTVVDYAESQGLTEAPVGVGLPFLLVLERGDDSGEALASATLAVEPQDGGSAQVFAMGAGQFVVFFDAAGSYRLVALEGGAELDALTVSAAPVDHVRLGVPFIVNTTGEECSTSEELLSLDGFVLHQNQELGVAVVPADVDDGPLMGLLTVTGEGAGLEITAFSFQPGAIANSLSIRPAATLGGQLSVGVSISEASTELPLSFGSSAEEIIPVCD